MMLGGNYKPAFSVQMMVAPPTREELLAHILRRYRTMTLRDRGLEFEELAPLFRLIDRLHHKHC